MPNDFVPTVDSLDASDMVRVERAGGNIVKITIDNLNTELGGGVGAVTSVNGDTGTVVLDAADVGADPAGSAAAVDADLDAHIADVSAAHAASAVSFSAGGSISSTDVQAAVAEVASDYIAAIAGLSATYQPLDADLTAIAAITTTSYGRAFLALANQAATMALLSAASATAQGIVELATDAETTTGTDTTRATTPANVAAVRALLQPLDADLTAIAALTTTAYGRDFLVQANAAAARAYIGVGLGTGDLVAANNLSELTATAATARTNIGLGTIATQAASSVTITGGSVTGITDITVADGGTGASTAAGAVTNLGLDGYGRGCLGAHSLATSFTTSATHTTFQDEGLTKTVNDVAGRRLKFTLGVNPLVNGGPNGVDYQLMRDGVVIHWWELPAEAFSTTKLHGMTLTHTEIVASTHASSVYKIQMRANVNNTQLTSFGSATLPRQLIIEDIGNV